MLSKWSANFGHGRAIHCLLAGAAALLIFAGAAYAESLTVSNTQPGGAQTSFSTEPGAVYLIEAQGEVGDWTGHEGGVDAVWCFGEWRCPEPQAWNQLNINGKGMFDIAGHELPYDASHHYQVEFTGDGAPIAFTSTDVVQGSFQDNTGAFEVNVTKLRDAPPPGGTVVEEETPQLHASIVCQTEPFVIKLSELPSRTCTVWISNWKRDTAEPVQLIMPEATDIQGNHNNGIEIFEAYLPDVTGTSTGVAPYNMSGQVGPDGVTGSAYGWGIMVFACPDPQHNGTYCTGIDAVPGPFSIPLIVRQKGALDATVVLTGTVVLEGETGISGGPPDGGDATAPDGPQLTAAVVCQTDPFVIKISELPSRTCTVWISNWRRDTAEPVQLIMPEALDIYGNHANGIEISNGYLPDVTGTSTGVAPYNMSGQVGPDGVTGSAYGWGITVFACPDPHNQRTFCLKGMAALPGPFSIPLIVRQKGARDAFPILTGTAVGAVPVAGSYVRIRNGWKTDQFLNIESGALSSSPAPLEWWSAMWTIEPVDENYVRIHNRWKPDQFLHIEHGLIESGPILPTWWSAMWLIERKPESEAAYICNRWKPDQCLHVEYGSLEAGTIERKWLSATWTFE